MVHAFIKIKDGQPEGDPIGFQELVQACPQISLPVPTTPSDLIGTGYGVYSFTPPPQPGRYEKVQLGIPVLKPDEIWYQQWNLVEMTPEEKQAVDKQKEDAVRSERNIKLNASDWTQLSDVPLSEAQKTEWVAYRKDLREVTSQPGFPWNVVWPTPPTV